MNKTVLNTIRFVVLILSQVLIVNHIRLGGYVNVHIYILFLMLLPLDLPKWQLLLAGFLMGLTIDVFMGTLGLHAGASVFMAFCRPSIVGLVSSGVKIEKNASPSISLLGGAWFFRYTMLMVLAHDVALFLLETFSYRLLGQACIRLLCSAPISIFVIMILMLLFKNEKTSKK